jgi:hypothetical protein
MSTPGKLYRTGPACGAPMSETISTLPAINRAGLLQGCEWDFRSAGELAVKLWNREICATELMERTITRIEALDGRFNAVVVRDFDRARDAAKLADAALARGVRKPLLGVPITVKEAFNVAGLPTTWGDPQFRDFVPAEDALVVSRLKQAGAIVVGKTNVPLGIFRATTRFTGPPTTRGMSAGLPADPRAGLPPRSRPAAGRFRSDRILEDPCACRRISAASMRTSLRSTWFLFEDMRRRRPGHCREAATSASQARWRGAPGISCLHSPSSPDRTTSVTG